MCFIFKRKKVTINNIYNQMAWNL